MSEKSTQMDVHYVARLARVELTPEEEELFGQQLGEIIHYIDKLNELDTEGVEPVAHAVSVHNVFRKDEARDPGDTQPFLDNAPHMRNRQVVVPKIIE